MPATGRAAVIRMRRIAARRDGTFAIRLHDEERALLAALPGQLMSLIEDGDSSLARLFPPAYADDLEHDREFQRLMHDDLVAAKRESAEVLAATAHATVLDEAQLVRWMGAINDLRLVIGTQMGIEEDTRLRRLRGGRPEPPPLRRLPVPDAPAVADRRRPQRTAARATQD